MPWVGATSTLASNGFCLTNDRISILDRSEDNIKEWTRMEFGDSLRAAEGWKVIVATSSVVPRRPPRLRD